ncbi:DDE-type integrase/transposase/recombinase [Algoriphagus sp. D3-2-R+10]|uniref:DDE-type integrase/transposase/recombinase n=1 Tax=Algoriphagus aurantiacus TaxID=3103948 RepID=UPI002B3CF376|nr:DDE-type integrase/transposase/recombinase [Algoriphagus sp. D3-2-R+10]MEB2774974.1 DDE-type integrase/transposase/recombinase [Algoriphagus sp. D3-2-R+10]
MKKGGGRSFDKVFKLIVVELHKSGKSSSEISRERGIPADMVSRWSREHTASGEASFAGNVKPIMSAEQKEIAQLKKVLKEAETERDILKKAVDIFSRFQSRLALPEIMDLFDRKIIGWSMSRTMKASRTVKAAFEMAIQNRPVNPGELIFHSNRRVQYACEEFRKLLQSYKILQSMSRKGNCWDNVVAENFFKILKSELIYQIPKLQYDQTRIEIFEFIEIW